MAYKLSHCQLTPGLGLNPSHTTGLCSEHSIQTLPHPLHPTHYTMTMAQLPPSVPSSSPVVLHPTNENNKRALQTDGESQEQSHSKKRSLTFIASWQKKTYTMSCTPEETVQQLKMKLQELTFVRPQNMKLLNLVKGKLPVSNDG